MEEPVKPRRPRMRSWEADPDIVTLLDLVQRSTGSSIKDLVNESIRTHAPAIIRRLLDARRASEAELVLLLEKFPGASPAPKAPSPEAKPVVAMDPTTNTKTQYRPKRPKR